MLEQVQRQFLVIFFSFNRYYCSFLKVYFIISGDNEETGVRTLEDPHRKILQRGSIDSFIMAVPK